MNDLQKICEICPNPANCVHYRLCDHLKAEVKKSHQKLIERSTMQPEMPYDKFTAILNDLLEQVRKTRDAGQAEYAHTTENVFANFDRVAAQTGMSREQVLMVDLLKHFDGIYAYIKGPRSQREPVQGRIIDAIVYLTLLYGMVVASEEAVAYEKYNPHAII